MQTAIEEVFAHMLTWVLLQFLCIFVWINHWYSDGYPSRQLLVFQEHDRGVLYHGKTHKSLNPTCPKHVSTGWFCRQYTMYTGTYALGFPDILPWLQRVLPHPSKRGKSEKTQRKKLTLALALNANFIPRVCPFFGHKREYFSRVFFSVYGTSAQCSIGNQFTIW